MADLGVLNTDHRRDSEEEYWEHLDVSRREVVQLCGEKGRALFTFLLSSSTIEPSQEGIAVVSLQRLSDVASQLGWSPDTVKRYVAVFRAVNLVQHYHDRRREVTLHIPLGPYTPLTNFVALNELMRKRQKQQQLALKVKTRYIMHFGDPTQAHSAETHARLIELTAILDDEHLEPLKRQRLQMKMADWLIRLAGKIEHSEVGDPNDILDEEETAQKRRRPSPQRDTREENDVQGVPCSTKTPKQGDLEVQEGDLLKQAAVSSRLHREPQGDSAHHQVDLTSPRSVDSVISPSTQEEQAGDSKHLIGDSSQAQQPLETSPQGDSNHQVAQKLGDSKQAEVEDDLLTYNVHTLISTLSLDNAKRKHVAQFLGKVLEDDIATFKKYLNLFKQYDPEVIGRAFLCTMVLMHREHWSIHRPGGFFTTQCWALSGKTDMKGYLREDVEGWLSTWGSLPYCDLIGALSAARATKPAPASLVANPQQTTPPSTVATSVSPNTSNTHFRQKRTYGMHLTRLPGDRKGFNTMGSLTPPPAEAEKLKRGSPTSQEHT